MRGYTVKKLLQVIKKPHFGLLLSVMVVFDAIFFGATDAVKVSSVWLLVGFLALALTIYAFATGLQRFLQRYGILTAKKGRRPAAFVAGVSVLLLALSSSGELTSRDAVVLLPLAALFYVYATYARRQKKPAV